MKSLVLIVVLTLTSAYAKEAKTSQKLEKENVQSVLKEAKKERKKKVEMCHDCGKPEVNCDCEGHGKNE
jgi:hypothetical protein